MKRLIIVLFASCGHQMPLTHCLDYAETFCDKLYECETPGIYGSGTAETCTAALQESEKAPQPRQLLTEVQRQTVCQWSSDAINAMNCDQFRDWYEGTLLK